MRHPILLLSLSLAACGTAPPPAPAEPAAAEPAAVAPSAPASAAPVKRVAEFTPPALPPSPSAEAVTAACQAAWETHGPAIEAALKARALKLALSVQVGQQVKDLRALVGRCPEPVQPALTLAQIAAQTCGKGPDAALPLTEAAVRFGTVASLCTGEDGTGPALEAVASRLREAAEAGCPVPEQAAAVGATAALRAAPTLTHVPEARDDLLKVLAP